MLTECSASRRHQPWSWHMICISICRRTVASHWSRKAIERKRGFAGCKNEWMNVLIGQKQLETIDFLLDFMPTTRFRKLLGNCRPSWCLLENYWGAIIITTIATRVPLLLLYKNVKNAPPTQAQGMRTTSCIPSEQLENLFQVLILIHQWTTRHTNKLKSTWIVPAMNCLLVNDIQQNSWGVFSNINKHTLPQNGHRYFACCKISIFLTCLRSEAP